MRIPRFRWLAILVGGLMTAGCCLDKSKLEFCDDGCYDAALVENYGGTGLRPEEPCLDRSGFQPWVEPISPRYLGNENVKYADAFEEMGAEKYMPISLEECVRLALEHSQVMRDLGGTILRNPSNQTTLYDPAIVYADPRTGEEAALSAFDANLFASAFFDYNDRAFNNNFFGNQGLLVQELGDYRWGISKQSATGTLFNVRHVTNRENNNQLGNRFGAPSSAYDTYVEGEARQPLLQGAGVLFNRINGTSQEVGVANGVLIARANTDIGLAQFEQGVRDLVSNVENAYWDLYFAYRDLDAKIDARDNALKTWRGVKRKIDSEKATDDQEGQAREQFFRFEAEVIDALHGRLVDGTRTYNGSSSGTFRSNGGVKVAERRLRLITGMQINDGKLLRPADDPLEAFVSFDWHVSTNEAIALRPELRQQGWRIKQREMELLASKNYLMPRLDAVGRYRFRGFGSDLAGGNGAFQLGDTSASAIDDMFGGDRKEWQVGVEFSMPFGFRKAHAAVRNAELQLIREKAILREQEREVMYGLSNAVDEMHRSYESMRAQYNRLAAATFQAQAVGKSYEGEKTTLDVLLEAQRRVVDAEIRYYQAQVEYMLAIKNVHYEKGTLLEYCNVAMAESMSPSKAYRDAAARDSLRGQELDYVCRDMIIASSNQGFHTMHPTTMVTEQFFSEAQSHPQEGTPSEAAPDSTPLPMGNPPSTPVPQTPNPSGSSPSDAVMQPLPALPSNLGSSRQTSAYRPVSAEMEISNLRLPPAESRPLAEFPPLSSGGSTAVVASPASNVSSAPVANLQRPATAPAPAPAASIRPTNAFEASHYHSISDQ